MMTKFRAYILCVIIGIAVGVFVTLKVTKSPQKPASVASSSEKNSTDTDTVTKVVEDVLLPNGVIGKKTTDIKEKKKEEKAIEIVEVKLPEPTLLFGYTFNVHLSPVEFSHSIYVGKKIFEEYIDNSYGVVGADVDNKMVVQQLKAGIIKLF
jgi:hypothetical protein